MSQKVDSKDFELVKSNPTPSKNKNNGSSGIELVTKIVQQVPVEVWKEGASTLLDQFNKHLDNEREGKKKIRETRIESLYLEIKNLIENIHREEAREDFNQERINKWYDRLDKKELELKEMQDDADGFQKGLLKLTKQFVAMRFRR
ncbi:hypothetical protein [Peribacillus simplex]|uniref:hypothetical protein n=1 Tax=Peribacillus simplex TaxID=1478 RepID=UPI0024BFAE38|nr:hypothetical protein [Peribacillus simplex]WHY95425.1 hypothetical protein QNH37_15545 [Peribacillus simplex]